VLDKTVLVTGGTGYVGSWVVKYLLENGYTVRVTVRKKTNVEKYQHLLELAEKSEGTIALYEADLLKEGSYDEPAKGCSAVFHIASPFILKFKDPQNELVDPALKGTKNVLNAASKSGTIKKVILTSSVAAVFGDNCDMANLGLKEFTEKNFNDTSNLQHQPYSYSKVLAEREAWKLEKEQSNWKLIVMNPSFVMGPPLSKTSKSGSIDFIQDMLGGKFYTGAPHLDFGFVDVRDVAKAHIFGLESEAAEGRHILCERTISMFDFASLLKEKYGKKYPLPMMVAPKFLLYLIGWIFGSTFTFVKRNVGYTIRLNATKSINSLGLKYRPLLETMEDMIIKMNAFQLLKK